MLATQASVSPQPSAAPETMAAGRTRFLSRPVVFLLTLWLLMSGSTLFFSLKFGLTAPFSDEWRWTALICGRESPSAKWFFQAENQHRTPLAKAIYLGLGWLTRFDLRAGAVFGVVVLSLLALALMVAARRIRGHASEVDAIFPLLLLNWGQYHNLMWGAQLYYVVNCVLAGVILLAIIASRERLPLAAAVATLVCLIGLATSGAGGIAYAPPLTLWLVCAGLARFRGPVGSDRWAGAMILALAALPALLIFWYFSAAEPILSVAAGQTHHLRMPLIGAIQVLSISCGRLGRDLWPFSGLLTVAVLLIAGVSLVVVACRRPPERLRALGLGLFLAAMLAVALGIGLTRSDLGPTYCLTARYITLACPLALCLYVIALCYGPAVHRAGTRWALVGAMLVITAMYTRNGIHNAADLQLPFLRLERSVRCGLPLTAVAARSFVDVQAGSAEEMTGFLTALRDARLGPYRGYQPAGPERDIRVVPLAETTGNAHGAAPIAYAGTGNLRQSFTAESPLPLYQIEFRARGNLRDRWTVDRLHWTLEETGKSGPPRVWAQGILNLDHLPDPLYATLSFPPIPVVRKTTFTLILSGAVGLPLRVPLYETGGGKTGGVLAGFLYFGSPSAW
jgi:hypothetical protein